MLILDLQELVLVKVKGIFYRGKVLENLEDQLAIFFVDYGSVSLVPCRDVFKWHPRWDTTPGELINQCDLMKNNFVSFQNIS